MPLPLDQMFCLLNTLHRCYTDIGAPSTINKISTPKIAGTKGDCIYMTEILSVFVSHPENVIALFGFLTYAAFALKSIILTKMFLKHGKKHVTVTKDLISF